MEVFYRWGFYLLAFNAFWSTITLFFNIYNWVYFYWWSVLPNMSSVCFSWLLAGFFLYLKKGTEPSISDDSFINTFTKEEN